MPENDSPDRAYCTSAAERDNFDLILAIITSLFWYLLIPPVVYIFGQILVPQFEVDFERKEIYESRIRLYEQGHSDQPTVAMNHDKSNDYSEWMKLEAEVTHWRFLSQVLISITTLFSPYWFFIYANYGN